MMKTYIKSEIVQAIQYTIENQKEITDKLDEDGISWRLTEDPVLLVHYNHDDPANNPIWLNLTLGSWMIYGSDGRYSFCWDETFKREFRELK